jgi:hypothetical protein
VVVAVAAGRVADIRAHRFSDAAAEFVEVPFAVGQDAARAESR